MARESDFTPLIHSPRWAYSLRHLFLWTAVVALACVALRSASATWVALMLGLTVLTMACALLLVVFRRGQQRAFWIGFATFGWLYLLLVSFSWNIDPNRLGDNPLRPANLITSQLSDVCYHWLYDDAFAKHYAAYPPAGYGGMMSGMMGSGGGISYSGYGGMGSMPGAGMAGGLGGPTSAPPPLPGPNQGDFTNVAHSLWTLLLATAGGCLALWLYATRPKGDQANLPNQRTA